MKYNVGDKVKVVKDTKDTQFCFGYGEVVTITRVLYDDEDEFYRCDSDNDYWFLNANDIVLYEENE